MPRRPNWSHPLPRPLRIPTVMDLKTLDPCRVQNIVWSQALI